MEEPKKYLVFTVQAYKEINPLDGRLSDFVELELMCATEEEAIARAKALVVKNNYRVSKVIENYYRS